MTKNDNDWRKVYLRAWRMRHPTYGRDAMRLYRAGRSITHVLIQPLEKHCEICTILLSSRYAEGGDGNMCGVCIQRYKKQDDVDNFESRSNYC